MDRQVKVSLASNTRMSLCADSQNDGSNDGYEVQWKSKEVVGETGTHVMSARRSFHCVDECSPPPTPWERI